MTFRPFTLAVLLPCRNEEETVAKVVKAFHEQLPEAHCYVYDNASVDRTALVAGDTGAVVRFAPVVGKGNVVRRMLADIEADIYILVDGDDTYDATAAPIMVEKLIADNLDMVIGVRIKAGSKNPYPPGHRLGNALLTRAINMQFKERPGFSDVCSGYRVMSRRFVKSFPATSRKFEIESELSTHCAHLCLPYAEIPTCYTSRPPGSKSKLHTFSDGGGVLFAIGLMVKDIFPLWFFSTISAMLALGTFVLAIPLFAMYRETGLVPRFPTAMLCASLGLLAFGSFFTGVILDSLSRGQRELKRLMYLRYPSVLETCRQLGRKGGEHRDELAPRDGLEPPT